MSIYIEVDLLQSAVILAGYGITIATSGLIVRHFVGTAAKSDKSRYDVGAIIGKCENFLTITLILSNAITALGLIFASKAIVRKEDINKDPKYYLGGTLVNFSYSVLMGFIIRFVLKAIGHPI